MNQSNDSFKNFVNNHKFTFVTGIASLLCLALGLVVFFPPHKRPFYSVKSFNLINDSSSTIENLDIKYKVCKDKLAKENCQLENIQSLTVTRILFWNGGRTKIDKTDIDDNPITIVTSKGNKILEAKLLHSSNKKTDSRLNQQTNIINFDFLDSGNGGVLQVVHTGLSDEDIVLDGYVEDSKFDGNIKLIKLQDYSETNKYVFTLVILPSVSGIVYTLAELIRYKAKDKKAKLEILKIEKILSENKNLSNMDRISYESKLRRAKIDLSSKSDYFSASAGACLFIIMLFYLLNAELYFLDKFTLRYPTESYEIFSSEINN